MSVEIAITWGSFPQPDSFTCFVFKISIHVNEAILCPRTALWIHLLANILTDRSGLLGAACGT